MSSFGGQVLAFHDLAGGRLRELIECLAPDEPVHLSELVDRVRRGKGTRGIFAITVDDGVGDTVRALSAVAQHRHWPVTFFVPTGYLDAPGSMAFAYPFWSRRSIGAVAPSLVARYYDSGVTLRRGRLRMATRSYSPESPCTPWTRQRGPASKC